MTTSRLIGPAELLSVGTANVVLQILTSASKAFLLIAMARYLTPADVGVIGLVFVTLSLASYLVGLDFSAFSMRELIRKDQRGAARILRDQSVLQGVTFALAVPLLSPLFVGHVLPLSVAFYFYALLLSDHIAAEMQRVLITLERPVQAAALFFLRGGVWVYPLVILLASDAGSRTIEAVLQAWLLGVGFSVVVGGYWLRDLWSRTLLVGSIDWKWIGRGLAICMPLLGASLAFRGLFSVDRYALQASWGSAAVGVYTFYGGIRGGLQSLMDMGLLAVLRPKIISAHQMGDVTRYRDLMRTLTLAVVGAATLLGVIAGLVIVPVLSFIENPIYQEHLTTYWIMLAVFLVAAIGEIPHSGLYAKERDRPLVVSTVASFLAAIVLNLLLVPRYGPAGAAGATLIACAVLGGAKAWYLGVGVPARSDNAR